jgi:hypothetical protein
MDGPSQWPPDSLLLTSLFLLSCHSRVPEQPRLNCTALHCTSSTTLVPFLHTAELSCAAASRFTPSSFAAHHNIPYYLHPSRRRHQHLFDRDSHIALSALPDCSVLRVSCVERHCRAWSRHCTFDSSMVNAFHAHQTSLTLSPPQFPLPS